MDITYYKVANDTIIQADQNIKPEDWKKKINWIDIRAENRKEVTDYLQELNLYSNLHECIEKPEEYPVFKYF